MRRRLFAALPFTAPATVAVTAGAGVGLVRLDTPHGRSTTHRVRSR